jgi:hypothetical protein
MGKTRIVLMLSCVVLLSSCGLATHQGYSGPKLPASEVGIICKEKIDNPVQFTAIEPNISGGYRCYELLPGTYRAKISYYAVDYSSEKIYSSEEDQVITFQVEAGRKYELRGTGDGVSWGGTIVDVGPITDTDTQ